MTTLATVKYQADQAVYLPASDWVPLPHLPALPLGALELGGTVQLSLFLGFLKNAGEHSFTISIRLVDAQHGTFIAGVDLQEPVSTVVSLTGVYEVAPRARPNIVVQYRRVGEMHNDKAVFIQGATMSLTALVVPDAGKTAHKAV